MGLDAVVYTNRKHLNLGQDEQFAQCDPERGEVYFENDEPSRKHRVELTAAEYRLGNIAAISALREEAIRLIGSDSVIVQKVLYSGTHSGDAIPLESLPALSAELDSIIKAGKHSPEFARLINCLQNLIHAANAEGNPIVFV
jgi:hypothetical protein